VHTSAGEISVLYVADVAEACGRNAWTTPGGGWPESAALCTSGLAFLADSLRVVSGRTYAPAGEGVKTPLLAARSLAMPDGATLGA
jgi:hypothetical protein